MTLGMPRPYRSVEGPDREGTPRGMEPFVLLEIARGPAHGYEIARAIGALGFRRAAEDPSVLYKLLRTFEEEGLATSDWAIADAGPPRRVYSLTSKGREYLAQRADDLERQQKRIEVFLDEFAKWKRKAARLGSVTKRRETRDG
jgi:PadR family transcriptional regulator, regulatory protein PadR